MKGHGLYNLNAADHKRVVELLTYAGVRLTGHLSTRMLADACADHMRVKRGASEQTRFFILQQFLQQSPTIATPPPPMTNFRPLLRKRPAPPRGEGVHDSLPSVVAGWRVWKDGRRERL